MEEKEQRGRTNLLKKGQSVLGPCTTLQSQEVTGAAREQNALQQLAWRAINRASGARLKRVAALDRDIHRGVYRIDAGKLSEVLLHPDDLNLTSLLSRYPVLITEHVALYGKHAAQDLLVTLETRDNFTGKHCARVTAITLNFARFLGLPQADLEVLKNASYLHDLGKVEISKAILLKKGRLTARERAIIEGHPAHGVRIAAPLHLVQEEQNIILHHHEQWDGRGYPAGLAGEQIPLLCRLVSLADVFEALTSDRPYRRRLMMQEALKIIRDRAGSQFDPYLTREFLRMAAKSNKF